MTDKIGMFTKIEAISILHHPDLLLEMLTKSPQIATRNLSPFLLKLLSFGVIIQNLKGGQI